MPSATVRRASRATSRSGCPRSSLLLFLRDGEVVNAISATQRGTESIAISSALARIPAEPEFGEIAFHEAPAELLVCMYHTLLVPPSAMASRFRRR